VFAGVGGAHPVRATDLITEMTEADRESRDTALVFGQMDELPARVCSVALSAMTMRR